MSCKIFQCNILFYVNTDLTREMLIRAWLLAGTIVIMAVIEITVVGSVMYDVTIFFCP